jgi:hypothetical protein
MHLMLTYRNSDELKFVGYADADIVGLVIQGSPRQVTLPPPPNGGAISGKSTKQSITASSTMRADFLSCYMVIGHVVWLKKFVPRLRVVDNISRPLTI